MMSTLSTRAPAVLMLAAVLLSLTALSSSAEPVSLMQKIQEANLTQFAKLLTDSGLASKLSGSGSCADAGGPCFIVFAPTDEAFAASATEVDALTGQSDSLARLVDQHIVNATDGKKTLLKNLTELSHPAAVGRDVGLGQAKVFIVSDNSSVLYWQAKETRGIWSYHANNARINSSLSNQEAANGVLHVLDDVALPLGRQLSLIALTNRKDDVPVFAALKVQRSVKTFQEWILRDPESKATYLALLGGTGAADTAANVRTVFLPTDAAWDALPQAALQALNESAAAFRPVLAAHLVPDVAMFTGWLEPGQAVQFVAGHKELKEQAGSLLRPRRGDPAIVSVGDVFAQVLAGSNLPLRDAVVHVVDRVLAAPGHRNLTEAARSLAPAFYELCRRYESCGRLLDKSAPVAETPRGWTLFAPVDVAGLTAADGTAVPDIEQILMLHFVPSELVPKCNMSDELLVSGANKSGQIRFRSSVDFSKHWVEGRLPDRGFVRAELQAWDEATQDGDLVHTVRTPLGRPTLSLRKMVAELPQLSAAARLIDTDAFQPSLGDAGDSGVGFTAFVPDDGAMAELDKLLLTNQTGGASGNDSLRPDTADDAKRSEALRQFILLNASFIADDAAPGVSIPSFRTARQGELDNATGATLSIEGSGTDRIAWLHTGKLKARARAAGGQYQCLNGVLYVVDSVTQEQHPRPEMIREGKAVSMATGSVALAAATALGHHLLLQLL